MSQRLAPLLVLAGMLAAGTANAQAGPGNTVGMRNLFDRQVASSDGLLLGVVKDLAINVGTGEAPWVAIHSGDVLALVPTAKLRPEGQGFRLGMTGAEFAAAPLWPADRLAAINRPAFVGSVIEHYRQPMAFPADAVAAVGEGTPFRFIGTPIAGGSTENFANSVKLIGDPVVLASGQSVGPISDLLLDMAGGRIAQAAIDTPNRRVAMGFPKLHWSNRTIAYLAPGNASQVAALPAAEWTEQVPQTAQVPPPQ